MFQVVTKENSQSITLNDNGGRAAPATWIIDRDVRAVGWAVFSYAKQNKIPARDVGYSLKAEG